jgi:hypothetical protein
MKCYISLYRRPVWVMVLSIVAACSGATASAAVLSGVTASSSIGFCCSAPVENITNGSGLSSYDPSAEHSGSGGTWLASSKTGFIDFSLNGIYFVTQIAVWNTAFGVSQYSLAASTDGVTYTPIPGFPVSLANVVSGTPNFAEIQTFGPVLATNIRMTLLNGYSSVNVTGLREVMFVGTAVPEPGTAGLAGVAIGALWLLRSRVRTRSARGA